MLNKSEIMKAAWETYRYLRRRYEAWQFATGRVDGSFSRCLKMAWEHAKEMAARAAAAAVEAKKPVSPAVQKANEEIARIRQAITDLQYLPFGMRVEPRQRALQNELSRWQAMAAAA